MIYQTVVALALVASSTALLYTSEPTHQKHMWETFKREHNRSYSTMEEETARFAFFLENLKVADLRNEKERKNGGTAVHGITKFSDRSQAEFEARFLTANSAERTPISQRENLMDNLAAPSAAAGLVDWTGTYTTPVKDQGYCGSCWAFSATSQIESDGMRTLGTNYILSPEQIVQCDKTSQGCNGGWTEHAYKYIQSAGGQETDSAYPYSSYYGTTGSCKVNSKSFVVKVNGYTTIGGSSPAQIEANMASYVQSTGPLSVCLDASSWNSYTGGIMTTCGNSVDHCVQAVGVDTSGSAPYWKVRNQWGTTWGEAGFIQLAYGQNTCAITNDATWVSVSHM